MIVPVAFRRVTAPIAVVIVAVIIPMIVRTHHLMLIRPMLIRAFLGADQRRGQCGHRERRQGEQCRFPKMLLHVAILIEGLMLEC